MSDLLLSKFEKPELASLLPKIERWLDSDKGQKILASEQQLVSDVLGDYFGYHLLQLGVDPRIQFFEDCRVQQKYQCHPFISRCNSRLASSNVDVVSSYEQLPFEGESLDVVVMHHVLEFVDDPHQLLREIQRLVIPQGHVVIIGFNPYSLLGVSSLVRRCFPDSIWHNRLLTSSRVKEWLSLLGFETQCSYFGGYSSAMLALSDKPWLRQALKKCPLGDFYVISAVKQVASITPLKPKWTSVSSGFAGLSAIKPRVDGARSNRKD